MRWIQPDEIGFRDAALCSFLKIHQKRTGAPFPMAAGDLGHLKGPSPETGCGKFHPSRHLICMPTAPGRATPNICFKRSTLHCHLNTTFLWVVTNRWQPENGLPWQMETSTKIKTCGPIGLISTHARIIQRLSGSPLPTPPPQLLHPNSPKPHRSQLLHLPRATVTQTFDLGRRGLGIDSCCWLWQARLVRRSLGGASPKAP